MSHLQALIILNRKESSEGLFLKPWDCYVKSINVTGTSRRLYHHLGHIVLKEIKQQRMAVPIYFRSGQSDYDIGFA